MLPTPSMTPLLPRPSPSTNSKKKITARVSCSTVPCIAWFPGYLPPNDPSFYKVHTLPWPKEGMPLGKYNPAL